MFKNKVAVITGGPWVSGNVLPKNLSKVGLLSASLTNSQTAISPVILAGY